MNHAHHCVGGGIHPDDVLLRHRREIVFHVRRVGKGRILPTYDVGLLPEVERKGLHAETVPDPLRQQCDHRRRRFRFQQRHLGGALYGALGCQGLALIPHTAYVSGDGRGCSVHDNL